MNIRFNAQTLRYISIFEAATGAEVKDCIERDNLVVFILYPRNIKKVLENKGEKIQTVRNLIRKNVMVVEYSSDVAKFARNLFRRYRVKNVRVTNEDEGFNIVVYVDPAEKARAIGKDGRNLKLAREIIERHFNLKNLIVA